MEKKNKRNVAVSHFRAAVNSETLNEDSRTIDVTWTTGHKGLRSSWEGKYYEELGMGPDEVDLSRLNSGAPFLSVHDNRSLDSVIGVIESARIEKGLGVATVRFSSDPDADRVFNKVKEGILRQISVGYSVERYEDVSGDDDEIPTLRATRWQPMELSVVPIGFDPGAQFREDEKLITTEVEIINRNKEKEVMSKPNDKTPVEPKEASTPAFDMEAVRKEAQETATRAVKAEQERCSEILEATRAAKLDDSYAQELIKESVPADEARKRIFAKMVEAKNLPKIDNSIRIEVGTEDREKKRQGFTDALLHRIDGGDISEAGRNFVGKGLLRSCEDLLGGRLMGESDAKLAQRAMSSSDLPLILANVAEKSVQKRYALIPRTWSQWAKTGTLRNFKEHSQVRAGDFSSLSEMDPESGEFTYGSMGEENETVQLKKYGKIHKFTEAMLVNDDTGLIRTVVAEAPIAAARLENRLVYSGLTTNKTMQDGIALYHADHGNLGTAGVIGETTFKEAFQAMREQMSVDGQDYLNVPPKFLICGAAKETEAKKFLQQIQATATGDVNVFSNSVQLVVDSEISGNQYYFAADPSLIDTVTLYRLEGAESPQIQTRVNWSDDSIEFKVSHRAAAAPMDFRGLYKNAGN